MNSDFKIVISLSHRRISFEYYLKGGAITLQPIKSEANRQGEWPAPFSIYCSPTGIIIGEDAYHAAQRGTKNAFDGLFECMENADCYYEFCGTKKHVSDLPLDACESIFRDFFSKVLLNNYGNLEQNRSTMPIVFVCEEDISDNQKAIINNKFKNSGYGCVSVNSYRSYIETFARNSYSKRFENALIVWTEGKDLYLTLIDIKGQKDTKTTVLSQLGVDPRLDFIIDEIWKAVMAWNYYLEKDKEIDVIKNAANRFLNSTEALVKGSVTLSDGNSYNYELERKAINHLPNATRIQLASGVREFLAKNDARPETTMVILRGVAANNNYFSSALEALPNIKVSDSDLRSQVMRTIIEETILTTIKVATPLIVPDVQSTKINPTPKVEAEVIDILTPLQPTSVLDSKPVVQEWKSKRADVKGKICSKKYQEAEVILKDIYEKATATNAVEVVKEIDELWKRIEKEPKSPAPSDTPKVNLTREWRELKGAVGGLLRSGKNKEAQIKLNDFIAKCKETNNLGLIDDVEKLLKSIPCSQTIERNKSQAKTKVIVNEEKKTSEGETLLNKGKIVEARDWYRNNGDINKSRLLNDIIRLQKSVETRKNELPNSQQTKDIQKIKRIIAEISDYIEKCQIVSIPTEEYKKLLAEYKKIK